MFLLHGVNNGKKTPILQNKFQTNFLFLLFYKTLFIDSIKHVFLFLRIENYFSEFSFQTKFYF